MLDMLLDTVAGPLVAVALGLVPAALLAHRPMAAATLPAALAIGFVIALTAIQGRPVWPPAAALDGLAAAPGIAAVGEWLRRGLDFGWRGSLALGLVAVAACGTWMLWPILSRGAPVPGIAAVAGVATVYFVLHIISCPAFQDSRNAAWMLLAAAAAPVIAIDGSLKLGQIAGALGAGLGTLWLGGLLLRRARVDLPLAAPLLLTLVFTAAWFYAETDPLALGGLVLASLLSQGLPHRFGIRSPLAVHLLLFAATAAALALALWRVWPEQSLY